LLTGPQLVDDGERTWFCLRSLTPDPDAAEVPWVLQCGVRHTPEDSVEDLGMPWTPTAPYGEPALLPDGDGGLVLITAPNPTGVVSGGGTSPLGLTAAHYRNEGWTESFLEFRQSFPTLPAAVLIDGDALVVVAAGEPGEDSRHTRGLHQARWNLESEVWSTLEPVALTPPDDGDWGLERPARGMDGDDLVLAGIGTTPEATWLVRAQSSDDGAHWTQASWIDEGPPVLPHLTPQVVDGRIWYGAFDAVENTTLLCSIDLQQASPDCNDTGAAYLGDFAVHSNGRWIVVADEDGLWRREAL
jgi:hypothetical protein